MTMIKCVECGKEISDSVSQCPECGCPVIHQNVKGADKTWKTKLKKLRHRLRIMALVCFCIACLFFLKGADVKNNYYNSDKYTSLNQNAYVGGDAYNYIINGTYFTGYSVTASAFLICGVICINGAMSISVKLFEKE